MEYKDLYYVTIAVDQAVDMFRANKLTSGQIRAELISLHRFTEPEAKRVVDVARSIYHRLTDRRY